MAHPVALFASDLDGTLVDRQDGIHPRDRKAIADARAAGVVVTIATGRLTTRTHPVAKDLGLDVPLVCADGGVIACGATERLLRRRAIAMQHVEKILTSFVANEVSSFVFTHGAIHSCERGREHHGYVSGWAHQITTHTDVLAAEVWRTDPEATVMLVGIGREEPMLRAEAELGQLGSGVELMSFTVGDRRVVRFVSRGVSKASGVAEVAERLEIPHDRVAVIGDWYNDVPMFQWAARSFAMPHAPADVKTTVTDVLPEGSVERGAIADALEQFRASL